MSETGKIRVVVRSRKVPTGTAVLSRPVYTMYGHRVGSEPKRVMLYSTTYEDQDLEAIEKGKKLARELGLELEVLDLSKASPLKRLSIALRSDGSPITILPTPNEPTKASTQAEPAQPLFEQSVNAN